MFKYEVAGFQSIQVLTPAVAGDPVSHAPSRRSRSCGTAKLCNASTITAASNQHLAPVPAHDCYQIQEAASHWHIGNVMAQDLIGLINAQYGRNSPVIFRLA
ncbi:MAG: hypothetical protein ACRBBQ_05540 [Cognatishimia sp.]